MATNCSDASNGLEEVGPLEAVALIESGALLLDVREADEWSAGHAPQARFIALSELGARLDEVPTDAQVVVVCRSGGRSAAAANALIERGVAAINLAGGMQAWNAASLPVVTSDGASGSVI